MPAKKKPGAIAKKLRETVWELDAAYDGDDYDSPSEIAEIFDAAARHVKSRGLSPTRDELLAAVAQFRGLDVEKLRRIVDGANRENKTAKRAAKGTSGAIDLDALRVLLERGEGSGFDDKGSKIVAKAWDKLAGAQLGTLFADCSELFLQSIGPVKTLAGLERAKNLTNLDVAVTPDCDLAPLAKLSKLRVLTLHGRREGLAPLAKVKSLVELDVETTASGLAQLAKLPALRSLSVSVEPGVPLAGLLALRKLGFLNLLAGERPLDADVIETMKALKKKKTRMSLSLHEKWPVELAARGIGKIVGACVEVNTVSSR